MKTAKSPPVGAGDEGRLVPGFRARSSAFNLYSIGQQQAVAGQRASAGIEGRQPGSNSVWKPLDCCPAGTNCKAAFSL